MTYTRRSVIGGKADTISMGDNRLKIDFSTDSFPKEHQVDISVSLDHWHQFKIPKGYKLLSQTYYISASEKLQDPVNLTIEHNAVITTEEEAKSVIILHESDEGTTKISQGHTGPNYTFKTFQLAESCIIASAGPDGLKARYFLSFYLEKISNHIDNPHLEILVLISPSRSTHEVFYTIDILL